MPRSHINRKQNPKSKIRKRRVSSSSLSSNHYRHRHRYFKRAIFSPAAVGLTPPVALSLIMASAASNPESPPLLKFQKNNDGSFNNINFTIKGKQAMSARKLAATLWEINGLHSPVGLKQHHIFDIDRNFSDADPPTPVCDQKIDDTKLRNHRRRSSAASPKFQITEYITPAGRPQTANSIEVASHLPSGIGVGVGESNLSVKTRLKDVNNSLIASKELVKVLFRITSQEEPHSSRVTLVSALRVELDRARLQVEKLIQELRSNWNQLDALIKQFAEEKAGWKTRERERIGQAVSQLAREVEIERKLRRQAERLNKKLGMELADTRAQLSRTKKQLDGERRSREVLEQTCDELARGIGEERAEVEEMKRESAKARAEVEKERQMLQLADVLREERVQMKLAEARYEYEEKNAALERRKSEIASYYSKSGILPKEVFLDFDSLQRKVQTNALENEQGEHNDDDGRGGVGDGEGDSGGDSELHSIKLNMENNNRSYRWGFACEGNDNSMTDSTSMDEVFKGRRSLSDKVQWETICLQRNNTSDGGIQWDFTKQANMNGLLMDKQRSSKVCQHAENNSVDEFTRRSPKSPFYEDSTSRPISTIDSSRLREACSSILQDFVSRREQQ